MSDHDRFVLIFVAKELRDYCADAECGDCPFADGDVCRIGEPKGWRLE